MLTKFIPGTTESYAYIGSQLVASSPPTDDPPPALSWR
jgi:hypothetical protein